MMGNNNEGKWCVGDHRLRRFRIAILAVTTILTHVELRDGNPGLFDALPTPKPRITILAVTHISVCEILSP